MPRFVHVVRALALLGSAASTGCASTIASGGDAAPDVVSTDTTTTADTSTNDTATTDVFVNDTATTDVVVEDTAPPDVTVTDAGPVDAGPGCPTMRPTTGETCQQMATCDYAAGMCVIDDNVYCYCAGPSSTWSCGPNCAIGPLSPPDLPA